MHAQPSPILRRLTPADWETWKEIRLLALKTNPDSFGSIFEEEASLTPADWQQFVAQPLVACYVLELADSTQPIRSPRVARNDEELLPHFIQTPQVIGCGAILTSSGAKFKHKGRLISVFIAPQARGRGYGAFLVKALLNEAREAKLSHITLATNAENKTALTLYHHLGFRAFGSEPRAYRLQDGRFVDDIHMAYEITL